ncbi:hypothetical protein [Pseudomonas sp. B28(2017)]|uniref:hypothetical protein n=1 Tax=Pseudomonas sp. B28(2017) TaxID=1981730 RepID=UPI000A1EEB5B|nr:hypothetical protein [Pseudomonas sp. B28(2017)]
MTTNSVPFNRLAASLEPLRIIGVLPPIPGGETNLLPKDAWLQALRVEFDLWSEPAPAEDATDVIQLIWDRDEANPVDTKSFPGPITEGNREDFWLEVPVSKLSEGVHSLYYRLLPWNGSPPRTSEPVDVTIDKPPPRLNQTNDLLLFPAEILRDGVTDAYLKRPENNDQVKAGIGFFFVSSKVIDPL